MRQFTHSAWKFFCATWGALCFAAVSFVDPVEHLKAMGLISEQWYWVIGTELRRAMFLVLAFLWMLVWYHRQRIAFEVTRPLEPDLPLHEACRWIARDSVWAEKFDPQYDMHWVELVAKELLGKVSQGRVEIFGEPWRHWGNPEAIQPVPEVAKRSLRWEPEKLATACPPTHIWSAEPSSAIFHKVMLNRSQVRTTWPRKNLWARLWGVSPIERLGGRDYGGKFSAQDREYRENNGFAPMPLGAMIG